MSKRTVNYLIITAVVVLVSLYIIWPSSPGINIGSVQKVFQTRLGLDLVGGVQALLEADLPPGTNPDAESMGAATRIVENRVNGLGVTEAVVQQAGNNRIVVELPGETDPEKALATLQHTGLLEFVDLSKFQPADISKLQGGAVKTDFGITPGQTITTTQSVTSTAGVSGTAVLSPTLHTIMTGADLKSATVQTNPTTGEYEVNFKLSGAGSKTFGDFTSKHVGDILAIVLDKKIISAPRINTAITQGTGSITGNFTYDTANALAIQLRYGSLPIPLKVAEVRTIGPSLGQDSLRKSLIAGMIGFTIVTLFMVIYYRLSGGIAVVAIIIYALIDFAIFRFIPVTMTLPGIAGFLLSTGSALDANILIFERLKEELRSGKNLNQSVDLGWRRAWPSIRDSNIATLITSTILFWFGSNFGASLVKGFSITLAIGVLVSLFCALVVTRGLMEFVLSNLKSKNYDKWFGL